MKNDAIINLLHESSGHGTRHEDVVAAFNAGVQAAIDACARRANFLGQSGGFGGAHELTKKHEAEHIAMLLEKEKA